MISLYARIEACLRFLKQLRRLLLYGRWPYGSFVSTIQGFISNTFSEKSNSAVLVAGTACSFSLVFDFSSLCRAKSAPARMVYVFVPYSPSTQN